MAPSPVKIRADFELNCFTYEGIDAIKHALLTAKSAVNDDHIQVAFKLLAPPHYKCECITLDKPNGLAKLELALEIIEKTIKEKSGTFKIINKPQIIGAKDDKDLIEIMDKIDDEESVEEDNEEGMGDIDIEGEEGEGDDDDEEETKDSKKSKHKKEEKKGKKDSDEEDDDDDDN